MNNPDLENTLSKLSIKPPSNTYVARARQLLGQQHKPENWWNKALAAALLASLLVNVWQYQASDQVAEGVQPATVASQDKPPSGGYSVVQQDASPDGHHQSITVIWEHKS